jgi:AcrR family transcriptional regulator
MLNSWRRVTAVPRLTSDDRRRQLIGIGLRLLTTTPIDELPIDRVAEEAGISRSLLFHYFPTKRDYYTAVVRAASRRFLRAATPPDDVSSPDRLRAVLEGLAAFIERRQEPYLSFVRGAAGGDPWLTEIHEETRRGLVDLIVDALGRPSSPALRLQVRGWIGYAEELIVVALREGTPTREPLIALLEEALHRLTEPS